MAQAKTDPSTFAPALHEQLKAAGMRLHAQGNRSPCMYAILWRRQCVVRDLTLLEAARFIDRALNR